MLEYTYGSDNGKGTVTYRSKPKLTPKAKPKPKFTLKPQPELQHTEPVENSHSVPDTPQYLMHSRDSKGRLQACRLCLEAEHKLVLHGSGH